MNNSKIMNVPNMLSLLRVLLVPVFFAALIGMREGGVAGVIVPAIIYALTAATDALDGKIARKYGLVTDFGKFIDPLADKFMVLGSMIAILTKAALAVNEMHEDYLFTNGYNDYLVREKTFAIIFASLFLVVLFRELAVTSMRLVVAGKRVKVDLAANLMGKLKTVSQMVGTVVIIIEPAIPFFCENHILSYVCMAVMAVTTVVSGINYFRGYLPHMIADEAPAAPDKAE